MAPRHIVMFPVALAIAVAPSAPASASSEQLVSTPMHFEDCRGNVDAMLRGLRADPANVIPGKDTAAHFEVKLVSRTANLLFLCNAVSSTLTVLRTTPGELAADAEPPSGKGAPVAADAQ